MSYLITKKEGLDVDYCGYDTEYSIDFTFHKQKANVCVEIWSQNPNKIRLNSHTDGYHWLQFLLSQEPDVKKLVELDFNSEISICQKIFKEHNIGYEQEGKETAWLSYDGLIDESFVKIIAEIIEPRFANRERFFE